MKVLLVLCAVVVVSGCADTSRCAGPLVPINAAAQPHALRAPNASGPRRAQRRAGGAAGQP